MGWFPWIDWLIDWLIDWWIDGLMDWWIVGLMDWWIDGLMDWWFDGLMDWWIDGLIQGGYCLALDMTARDFQNEAKAKGHPWTMAKVRKNIIFG